MTPTTDERAAAYVYMRRHWKDAHSLRFEGKCPSCKKQSQWSCQTDSDHPRGKDEETCGYFCMRCHWSNAGSRPIENDEVKS